MRIDVNEQYMVTLREVYNPVIIRDESAGGVAVCERDGKIEVTWLKAGEDTKEQIANSPASPVQHAKHAEALREIADNMERRINQQPVSVGELIRLIEMSVRQLRALQ